MKSNVQNDKVFPFWALEKYNNQLFDVEWLMIKDVPFKQFWNISIKMTDGVERPVTFSRDSQEVPLEQARMMLEVYENSASQNTILEHFEYYDMRQDNYEKMFPMGLY